MYSQTKEQDIAREFYEGGKVQGATDFWNANNPFELTANTSRDTLRARARWLHENNGIISGIDDSLKNNVIGTWLKLQSKTGDNHLDNAIEKLWNEWAEPQNCDFTERDHFGDIQRTIFGTRMTDGEVLINKVLTKDKRHPLKLQIIEADRFSHNFYNSYKTQNDFFVDGIELGKKGEPKFYHISEGWAKSVVVPANNIIHYYKRDNRSTQYRGISEYKQVIIDLRNLAGYTHLTMKGARARASLAYAVETADMKSHLPHQQQDDRDRIEYINDAIVYYLSKGEKLLQLDGSKSQGEFGEFVKTAIRLIAVGRKISYELAFRDYSQVNFSSARASIIQDHKRFTQEQIHITRYLLTPIFRAWIEANVLAGNLPISPSQFYQNRQKFIQPRWIAPVREWVDPLKDMKAIEKELSLGLTTLENVLGARGLDLVEVIEQRKKEKEMLKKAGILLEEDLKVA